MQYSQEHLKTMVYAKFLGANRVYYGEFENSQLRTNFQLHMICKINTSEDLRIIVNLSYTFMKFHTWNSN